MILEKLLYALLWGNIAISLNYLYEVGWWRDGNTSWAISYSNCSSDLICFSVDDTDITSAKICDIGIGSIWCNGNTSWAISYSNCSSDLICFSVELFLTWQVVKQELPLVEKKLSEILSKDL